MKSDSQFQYSGPVFLQFKIFLTYTFLPPNDKYKHAYSKNWSLIKRQLCTCSLRVCWCSFSAFWPAEYIYIYIYIYIYKYILNDFESLEFVLQSVIYTKPAFSHGD